jgi:ATP-dependent protease ClpP protease subunit
MSMPKLLQLFQDNQSKPRNFRVKAEGNEAEIYLYDAIGAWFGVAAEDFVRELRALDNVDTIHLRMNSPGGDVFEGRAMATALAQVKARTVCHIEGLAASAATYVAEACDEVEIADGGFFMIHEAWTLTLGNKRDHQQQIALLEKVDDSILNDYAKRTKAERQQLIDWMQAETWFTAAEAVEHGFADRVLKTDRKQNRHRAQWNLAAYHNVPAALTEAPPPEQQYDRAQAERRLALLERR